MSNIEVKNNEEVLLNFIPASSKGRSNISIGKGVMSVVNAKTCKRISINKDILSYLNIDNTIQFAFSDNEIAIGKELPNNENYFHIKISKNKGLIYCSELVSEITDIYGLDFSSRTSITFDDIQYQNIQGVDVVIIKVNY